MFSPSWMLCLVGFFLHISFSFAFRQRSFHLSRTVSSSQRYSGLQQDTTNVIPTDLILSSGFCAFARQSGVLSAIEDFKISIDRVVGTRSAASMLYPASYPTLSNHQTYTHKPTTPPPSHHTLNIPTIPFVRSITYDYQIILIKSFILVNLILLSSSSYFILL